MLFLTHKEDENKGEEWGFSQHPGDGDRNVSPKVGSPKKLAAQKE